MRKQCSSESRLLRSHLLLRRSQGRKHSQKRLSRRLCRALGRNPHVKPGICLTTPKTTFSDGDSLPPDGAVPLAQWKWVRGVLQHFCEQLVVLPIVIGIGLLAHLILDLLLPATHHQVTRFTAEVAFSGFCIVRRKLTAQLTAQPPSRRTAITDTVSTVILYPNLQLVKRHCHVCMASVAQTT